MKVEVTVEGLEVALKAAAEAHHMFEEKLGHRDEEWAKWYAVQMFQTLREVEVKEVDYNPVAGVDWGKLQEADAKAEDAYLKMWGVTVRK